MRYEEADFRPAADFISVTTGDDGSANTSLYFEDRQQSVNIRQDPDGTWLATIEDFGNPAL